MAAVLIPLAIGCARLSRAPVVFDNPVLLPPVDRDYVWDQVVDVVDDYFEIEGEERIRLAGDVLTVGRIDTLPLVGATVLEPWRPDSANRYERLHCTLQSVRRRAMVQVTPSQLGYLVDVAVFKELEDVPRPENSTTAAATFRSDNTLPGHQDPVGPLPPTDGWIPLGRDCALEQKIIARIIERVGAKGVFVESSLTAPVEPAPDTAPRRLPPTGEPIGPGIPGAGR